MNARDEALLSTIEGFINRDPDIAYTVLAICRANGAVDARQLAIKAPQEFADMVDMLENLLEDLEYRAEELESLSIEEL